MLTREEHIEYKFFKSIVKITNAKHKHITKDDINKIYKSFIKFCKKMKLDELDLLRKGEVFLGKYCDTIDYSNLDEVLDAINRCFYNAIELTSPVALVMIAAISKLSLAEFDGKEIINKETDNNENEDL